MMYGSLDIDVMLNPFDEDSWNPANGDHHTGLEITGQEWEQLMFKVLQAPEFQEYVEGENSHEYFLRQEKLLNEHLTAKGYPMLGHLWCSFIWWNGKDVNYAPLDVRQLLEECQAVQQKTENVYARSGLAKLITACHDALAINGGLSFTAN